MSLPEWETALTDSLLRRLNPNLINGIKTPERYFQILQDVLLVKFSKHKTRIAQKELVDIALEKKAGK